MHLLCAKNICQLLLLLALLPLLSLRAAAAAELTVDRRTIVVGGDRDYPPYEFIDRDGRPTGYNVDLTRAIAEVMGVKVEFRFGSWSDARG